MLAGSEGSFSVRPPNARLPPSPPRPPDPLPDIRNLNSGLQCVLLQDIKKDRCLEKYLLDRQVAGRAGSDHCESRRERERKGEKRRRVRSELKGGREGGARWVDGWAGSQGRRGNFKL